MLRVLSFHSVKGGVGKSTLATLAAHGAARQNPEMRVVLIDMDLTGTSLADVLPIAAPFWGSKSHEAMKLLAKPDGYLDREASLEALEARDGERPHVTVPVLNDYLLFASPDWDAETDIPAESLFWRFERGPENLFVIPSSALPVDLEATLPVIFDEDQSAYLESRLEYLLADLASKPTWVIFDVPPTIPGLSRAVLSLALRLGGEERIPLTANGPVLAPLDTVPIRWRAGLVASPDQQDRIALARWIAKLRDEEQARFKVILNRVVSGGRQEQIEHLWRHGSSHDAKLDLRDEDSLLDDVLQVSEDAMLQFFGNSQALPQTHRCIDDLLALVDP